MGRKEMGGNTRIWKGDIKKKETVKISYINVEKLKK